MGGRRRDQLQVKKVGGLEVGAAAGGFGQASPPTSYSLPGVRIKLERW